MISTFDRTVASPHHLAWNNLSTTGDLVGPSASWRWRTRISFFKGIYNNVKNWADVILSSFHYPLFHGYLCQRPVGLAVRLAPCRPQFKPARGGIVRQRWHNLSACWKPPSPAPLQSTGLRLIQSHVGCGADGWSEDSEIFSICVRYCFLP